MIKFQQSLCTQLICFRGRNGASDFGHMLKTLFPYLVPNLVRWNISLIIAKHNLHFLVSSLISCFLLKKCFVVCGFVKNTFWQKTFILLFIIITIANFWHKPLSEKLNIKAAAASATSMTKLANVVASTTERQLLRQSVFDTFGLMYKKALFVYSSTIQTNKPQNIIFLRNFYRLCTKQVTLVPLTFLSIFLLNIVVISKVKNA